MSLAFWLDNLLAYGIQVALLVIAAGALAAAFRLRAPKAALAYWHGVLAAALLLPALQPWQHAILPPPAAAPSPVISTAPVVRVTAAPVTLYQAVALLLALGFAARLLWLAAGFWRLRLYRRRACMLNALTPVLAATRSRLGVGAPLYISDEIEAPVTFGLLRPAVILPRWLLEMEPSLQEAIACHELLHVRRRDWVFTVFEELVRALLWFHPAIWWLLARIQLSREQAVDREVIAETQARQHYLNALLEVANVRRPLAALAPLFLRKRHFTQRVALILKEVSMSRPHLILTFAGIAALLIPAATLAVKAFPLAGQPVIMQDQPQDQPASKVPQRIRVGGNVQQRKLDYQPKPVYPPLAKQAHIQGTVRFTALIGTDGAVKSFQLVSGHPLLVQVAQDAVQQWHYRPTLLNGVPVEVLTTIDVNFTLAETPDSATVLVQGERTPAPLYAPMPFYPPGARGAHGTVTFDAVIAPDGSVKDLHAVDGNPVLIPAAEAAVKTWRYAPMAAESRVQISVEVSPRVAGGPIGAPVISFPTGPPEKGVQRIRVDAAVAQKKLIYSPPANYPAEAQRAGIQGVVRFNVLISADGTVKEVQLLSGHPLLVPAAQSALKQYRYSPTLLNGEPVEVVTQVEVSVPEGATAALAEQPTFLGAPAFRVGDGVSAPVPLRKVEPSYSPEALAAKLEGTVIADVVIGTDGLVHNVRIKRPLGVGLDEKAIEALQQWRFEPGRKDGQPVPVLATVEINFRLK